jgi:hypothetical protein
MSLKGTNKIFKKLESKVPFKKGHKVKYESPMTKLTRKPKTKGIKNV